MGNGCRKNSCEKKVSPKPISKTIVSNVEIEPTEIPNGCCLLYAGASVGDNQYTCPVLAAHIWDKSIKGVKVVENVSRPSDTSNTNATTTMIPNTNENTEYKVGINHEIQMLPIEDIISMKISTEVNKAVETVKSVALIPSPPTEKLTCYQKMKNVVCCKKKKNEPEPKYDFKTKEKQKATRTIIVTIEYIRYSMINAPSHLRVLTKTKQDEFYEEQLQNIVQQHRIRHFGQIINQDIPVL